MLLEHITELGVDDEKRERKEGKKKKKSGKMTSDFLVIKRDEGWWWWWKSMEPLNLQLAEKLKLNVTFNDEWFS